MRAKRFFRGAILLAAAAAALAALEACRSAAPDGGAAADDAAIAPLPPAPAPEYPTEEDALAAFSTYPEAVLPAAGLYVLRWNPDVSSFKDGTFREGFERLRRDGEARTNWSLHDWQDVEEGDWAVFVRVGGSEDGIAGLCRFGSGAYEGASWRGDGSTIHYADIAILLLNDPAATGLLGADELEVLFPEIDWHGGPSGVRIPADTADRLARHVASRIAGAAAELAEGVLPEDAFAVSGDDPLSLAEELLADLCPGDGLTPDDAAFAAALLRTASGGKARNAAVSPSGAEAAVALLAPGARGETAEALLDAFGAYGREFWAARLRRDAAAVPGVELDASLSLWLREGLPLAPACAGWLASVGVPMHRTPMDEDGRRAINAAIADATRGRVEEMLPAPLEPDSALLALHTLWLKARWERPFGAEDTVESVFHAPGGDVRTPFMNLDGDFVRKRLPGSGWTALVLPYAGGALEMAVLVPPRDAAPERIGAELADVLSAEWIAGGRPVPVFLSMPKFSLAAANDGLERALADLGAGIALGDDADFSGIVPDVPLHIGRIVQQLRLDVDEDGTEAASATAAVAVPASAQLDRPKPARVLLNRPFAFSVRDRRTGAILVLGQIFDPSADAR